MRPNQNLKHSTRPRSVDRSAGRIWPRPRAPIVLPVVLVTLAVVGGCLPSAPRVDDRAEPDASAMPEPILEGASGPERAYEEQGVGCTVVSAYEPSERAREDECYPLGIDPEGCVSEALALAQALERGGVASAADVRECLDGARVLVPADDAAFTDICGGDEGTLGCTFRLDRDWYPVVLRWDMTLVTPTFSRPVIQHEMIHRVLHCLEGDGDGGHERTDFWIRYESWDQYDRDPDGNGEPGCQTTCGGC